MKPGEKVSSLSINIKGKSAVFSFDQELFWLNTSNSKESIQAQLCVPHALVLDCSVKSDSKGFSLTVKLLSPQTTSILPFKKSKVAHIVETRERLSKDGSLTTEDRLKAQLQGPCTDLRLVSVEARVDGTAVEEAKKWIDKLMLLSYPSLKPHRKLQIIINPVGGAGHALTIFKNQVKPILEAAGCTLEAKITTHVNHGTEIVSDLPLNQGYDAIVCVSGDGMIYEILNGLARRSDANEAMKIPIAPIPAGSGNAIAHNLLGVAKCNGDLLALACLNAIKGKAMLLNVCTITQPAEATLAKETGNTSTINDNSTSHLQPASTKSHDKPYTLHYTFLSQAIGLMADLDLGTENIRALGDIRFVLGYLKGTIFNQHCEVDIYVKFGKHGTTNKEEMRKRMQQIVLNGAHPKFEDNAEGSKSPDFLRNGAVTDPLPNRDDMPIVNLRDPSWVNPLLVNDKMLPNDDPDKWYRIEAQIAAVYAGKIPFVAQNTLSFPYANPGDDCVDLYLHLMKGGRPGLLRAVLAVDKGIHVYDQSITYLKVDAYRVVPRLKAGDKRLIQGGLVSIDGERRPYDSYQVEVHPSLQLRVMSLYGTWCVPDVAPPSK